MIHRFSAVLGLAACVAQAAHAQLDTGHGRHDMFPFGAPNTATYGQTFTAPVGALTLDGFRFLLRDRENGAALRFRAYVMAWDGEKAAGPVLFESAEQAGPGSAGWQTYHFITGGIGLTPGAVYVAFLNASPFVAANPGTLASANLATTSPWNRPRSSYAGGGFVFANNGADVAALTSAPWGLSYVDGIDATFRADITRDPAASVVPEPASVALLGTGLAGLALGARRRRRAR